MNGLAHSCTRDDEIQELWLIAQYYFDLSKDAEGIYANAHIASCAMRLYSIEEILYGKSGRDSPRYKECKYEDLFNLIANGRIGSALDRCIHFLLRHFTVHFEDYPFKDPEHNKWKNAVLKHIQSLSPEERIAHTGKVLTLIEQDLKNPSLP